jgi:hypothetical protein
MLSDKFVLASLLPQNVGCPTVDIPSNLIAPTIIDTYYKI